MGGGRTVSVSVLVGDAWRVDDEAGSHTASVECPIHAEVARFEARCARGRPVQLAQWNWSRFVTVYDDRYAVRIDDGDIVAMWVATTSIASVYVLEFLEVVPDKRGQGIWGAFAFAAVCFRARELGATRVVFGSLPERASWYRSLGARDEAAGWTASEGLVPMHVDEDTIAAIAEELDADEEEEAT